MGRDDQGGSSTGRPSQAGPLDEVLNDLEGMLRHRPGHGATARGDTAPQASASKTAEPYTLPLLDDVVVPGSPAKRNGEALSAGGAIEPESAPGTAPPDGTIAPPNVDDLVGRLASELGVIIETSVDEALAQVKSEILTRVKQHLDIVLPELLEEALDRRFDDET